VVDRQVNCFGVGELAKILLTTSVKLGVRINSIHSWTPEDMNKKLSYRKRSRISIVSQKFGGQGRGRGRAPWDGGHNWPRRNTPPPHVLSCQLWSFLVYEDPPENGPLASRLSRSLKVSVSRIDRLPVTAYVLVIHNNYGPVSFRMRDRWWFITQSFFLPDCI